MQQTLSIMNTFSQSLCTVCEWLAAKGPIKVDVTRDDLQRQFLVQHSVAMLEQCWNHSKECRNNIAML